MIAGYRDGRYSARRQLPPKVAAIRSYGKLQLQIGVPRWVDRVGEHTRLKIRFWGEEDPLLLAVPAEGAVTCEYDIVVPVSKLIAYLQDMKILKLEFEDARNSKIVAIGVLNMQLFPFDSDYPSLDATVPIHSLREKTKRGEVEVSLKLGKVEELEKTQLRQQRSDANTIRRQNSQQRVPASVNEPSARPTTPSRNVVEPKQIRQPTANRQRQQQHSQQNPPQGQPTLYRKTAAQNMLDHHLVHILNGHCCQETRKLFHQNFDAEIERLRLDELQLLNSKMFVDRQRSGLLSLQIDRCEKESGRISSNLDYRLMVEFPAMVGEALKMNVFDLACSEVTTRQVLFGQQIQISTIDAESNQEKMRRYLNEQAKFSFMERGSNGDCKIIGQGTVRLSALIVGLRNSGNLRLHLYRQATSKKDIRVNPAVEFNLFLKSNNLEYRPLPEQKQQSHVNQQQAREEPIVKLQQPRNEDHSGDVLLMLSVGKYHNLRADAFRDNNYMLRVKVACQTLVSATIWNDPQPNFNFSSAIGVNRGLTGIIVEVWNKGTNGSLIGVAKIDTKFESLIVQATANKQSVYPFVVYEDELSVINLQGITVGYLSAVVVVGSVEQINRYTRSHLGRISKPPQTDPAEPTKPSELQQEETSLHRPTVQPKIPVEPAAPTSDPDPHFIPPTESEAEQPEPHRIKTQPTKLIDLLSALLGQLSRSPIRKELIRLLNGRTSLSVNELRDLLKSDLRLELEEWATSKVCFFFTDNYKVSVPQLIASQQSYEQYSELLFGEYTGVVRDLLAAMQRHSLTFNQLEIELAGKAHRLSIFTSNFKQTLRRLLPSFELVNIQLLMRFCAKDEQVNYGSFCDMLRRFEVRNRVSEIELSPQLLMQIVGGELTEILAVGQHNVHDLLRAQVPQTFNHVKLIRVFESVGITLSFWEAFNVIEYIKRQAGDDLQPEGDISRELFRKWLSQLLNESQTRMVRSPTFADNLFQTKQPLHRALEEEEPSGILPIVNSLDEQSASINQPLNIPSPIHAPPLQMRINFTARVASIVLNGKAVRFRVKSPSLLLLECRKESYYSIELALQGGQEYQLEGAHDEWIAVTDDDSNYVGALRINI